MIVVYLTLEIDKSKTKPTVGINSDGNWFQGGPPKSDNTIEDHRNASIVFDRVLDFAERMKANND